MSLSGDYAIVGAYGDDDNGAHSGSAYIFERSGTEWIQRAKLTASDGLPTDGFGWCVSLSGDYAIVGSPSFDGWGLAGHSGSAYIFKRTGTEWIHRAKLIAMDGAINNGFGGSVNAFGNYTIVGAFGCNSAYIYTSKKAMPFIPLLLLNDN